MKNRQYDSKALSFAKNLRQRQTDAENTMWYYLRDSRFNNIKFRRQVPIGKYIVDFVCLKSKLVIELDGGQHIDNAEYDSKRTEYLQSLGYTVIRYFDNEVFLNIEGVLQDILNTYNNL